MKFAVPSFALIFSFCFCGVKTPIFSKDHAKRSKQLETNVYTIMIEISCSLLVFFTPVDNECLNLI